MTLRVDVGARSSSGMVRSANQDSFGDFETAGAQGPGRLLLIADGMGGAAGGEIASRLAVDVIGATYAREREHRGPEAALAAAFALANRAIHDRAMEDPDLRGMGTTGVALVMAGERAWVAHVGDSRAYRIGGGKIERLTDDHSLAARGRAFAHVLTRALGVQPEVEVDIAELPRLRSGDVFVLCSDGLWGQVADDEIRAVVDRTADLHTASDQLIALANGRGGPDNVTVVLARVETGVAAERPAWRLGELLRRAASRLMGGAARMALVVTLVAPWALGACAQKPEHSAPSPSPAPGPADASPAEPGVQLVQDRAETVATVGYTAGHGVVLRVEWASIHPAVAAPGDRLVLWARVVALAPTEETRLAIRETWSVLFAGFPLLTLPDREYTLAQGTSEIERAIQLPADAADGDYAVEVVARPMVAVDLAEVKGAAPFVVAAPRRPSAPERPAPGRATEPDPAPSRSVVIKVDSVDLRTGPGPNFRARARVARDTAVELLEERQSGRQRWYRVRLPNGDDGWIPSTAAGADAR